MKALETTTDRQIAKLEASLRHKARSRGFRLRKCRVPYRRHPAFGTYGLVNASKRSVLSDGSTGYGVSLEAVADFLKGRPRIKPAKPQDDGFDRHLALHLLDRRRFRDAMDWRHRVFSLILPEFYPRRWTAARSRRGHKNYVDEWSFRDWSFSKLERRLERAGEIERICDVKGRWKVRLTEKGQRQKDETLERVAKVPSGSLLRTLLGPAVISL